LLIGLVVGLAVALVSVLFRFLWGFSKGFILGGGLWVFLLSGLALLSGLLVVRVIARERAGGCGTHRVVEAYNFGGGFLGFRESIGRTLASVLTIGLGGSAGMEGPSLLLGGGIASSLYRLLGLSSGEGSIYMLAGAAAGLSAIFKAPLTGILFALEIPFQRDLAKEAFIPATFSSVVAYLVSVSFLGGERVFPKISGDVAVSLEVLAHSAVLGVLAGLFARLFIWFYEWLGRFRFEGFSAPLIGGILLGIIGMFAPQVLGLGYESIHAVLSGEAASWGASFILLLLFLKIFATSVTLNMGGSGGLFVPSLFVGAMLGAAYSRIALGADNAVLIMCGMAGVVAAGNKTLLASVALVAETAGTSSIMASLVAATVAYYVSGEYSFYRDVQPARELGEEKILLRVLHRAAPGAESLGRVRVREVMERGACLISQERSIREAFETLRKNRGGPCFVVDYSGIVLGELGLDDVLTVPEEKWGLPVKFASLRKPLTVDGETSLRELLDKMIETGEHHAVVVDASGKIMGYVSWFLLLSKLAELLRKN